MASHGNDLPDAGMGDNAVAVTIPAVTTSATLAESAATPMTTGAAMTASGSSSAVSGSGGGMGDNLFGSNGGAPFGLQRQQQGVPVTPLNPYRAGVIPQQLAFPVTSSPPTMVQTASMSAAQIAGASGTTNNSGTAGVTLSQWEYQRLVNELNRYRQVSNGPGVAVTPTTGVPSQQPGMGVNNIIGDQQPVVIVNPQGAQPNISNNLVIASPTMGVNASGTSVFNNPRMPVANLAVSKGIGSTPTISVLEEAAKKIYLPVMVQDLPGAEHLVPPVSEMIPVSEVAPKGHVQHISVKNLQKEWLKMVDKEVTRWEPVDVVKFFAKMEIILSHLPEAQGWTAANKVLWFWRSTVHVPTFLGDIRWEQQVGKPINVVIWTAMQSVVYYAACSFINNIKERLGDFQMRYGSFKCTTLVDMVNFLDEVAIPYQTLCLWTGQDNYITLQNGLMTMLDQKGITGHPRFDSMVAQSSLQGLKHALERHMKHVAVPGARAVNAVVETTFDEFGDVDEEQAEELDDYEAEAMEEDDEGAMSTAAMVAYGRQGFSRQGYDQRQNLQKPSRGNRNFGRNSSGYLRSGTQMGRGRGRVAFQGRSGGRIQTMAPQQQQPQQHFDFSQGDSDVVHWEMRDGSNSRLTLSRKMLEQMMRSNKVLGTKDEGSGGRSRQSNDRPPPSKST